MFVTLALVTPIFGFALTPPPVSLAPLDLALDVSAVHEATNSPSEEDPNTFKAELDATMPGGTESKDLELALGRRARIAKLHRGLGIATWASMTVTVVLGAIQYHNLYGFFADQGSNPCVEGNAIFGQGQCSGTPWPHLISAITTTSLYSATFALSFFMPDPLDASKGNGKFAKKLRVHKALRWVHLTGMVTQLALGIFLARADNAGIDRANDYEKLRRITTIHYGVGIVTYGALTAAGVLMF